jgi:hypothetical protein
MGVIPTLNGRVRGMAAIARSGVSYVDTGDGITPDNFQGTCCGSWFQNVFDPVYASSPKCLAWMNANEALFAESFIGKDPCSTASQQALTYPALKPPVTTSGPAPAIDPETGLIVQTDVTKVPTDIAQAGADQNRTSNLQQAAQIASDQCAAKAAECKASMFAAFVDMSDDCSECVFSPLKPGSMLLVLGGVLIGGIVLIKLLK